MTRSQLVGIAVIGCTAAFGVSLSAHAPSGAIFTTTVDGSEVNANQYPSKEAVYLDGGPGIGAPQTAAGLDDGTYVFQVTDPSGKTLLSTDPAQCRQFTVKDGIITSVAPSGACAHNTGVDQDHGAVTVQLMPYDDTPNPGGVYKVWVTFVEDYLLGCAQLGVTNGLAVVDCGGKSGGNAHGFIPAHSKTDNFKVKNVPIREIDTVFVNSNGQLLSGLGVTWIDTLGVENKKFSYLVPFWEIVEAHVEAVEDGIHVIVVDDQAGCTVGDVLVGPWGQEQYVGSGPMSIVFQVKNHNQAYSPFVRVNCE